ncbi:MAG: N-acetylmuramoyl-L-alanine amidase [Niastella sp.]|nr:N-acetylmuramoyl-L-alanine amidase [Niastella sp.]
MKPYFSFCILLLIFSDVLSQENPFIKLVEPNKTNNKVSASRQFLIGSTCKTCNLTVNGENTKVYATGAFAYELNLHEGDTNFILQATNAAGKKIVRNINFNYKKPEPPGPVTVPAIESIQTFPAGNLVLSAGDKISFTVKALPQSKLTTYGNTVLYELPESQAQGMPGIYQGEYIVKPTDDFASIKFPVTLEAPNGEKINKETRYSFSVMSPLSSDVCYTSGRLAHLVYGLGQDRLGGAKMGYIDSLIPLKIVGKVGSDYKIQLAKSRIAYIPDDLVTLAPKGTLSQGSLTGAWQVYGDSVYDYVQVNLSERLPYQSMQFIDPSRVVVDIFGATGNTNWIKQLPSAKEISNVDYEQISDDIFRVTIWLKHAQHWGHHIYYNGKSLVIKIKQQPQSLALKNMTIAIDAGHGGNNTGAGGPTGSSEKMIALSVSLKLQKALEKEGAKVIMTRTTEKFFDNKQRILFYRDSVPDLLLSVHLNSAADPIRGGGTGTFYRYLGFRPLSVFIHSRMLELGLKDYGNIGSFNFMLNSPTEYPNALIETLFISNPEEEMLVLDEVFQQKMADKIVAGVKDFLQHAARGK